MREQSCQRPCTTEMHLQVHLRLGSFHVSVFSTALPSYRSPPGSLPQLRAKCPCAFHPASLCSGRTVSRHFFLIDFLPPGILGPKPSPQALSALLSSNRLSSFPGPGAKCPPLSQQLTQSLKTSFLPSLRVVWPSPPLTAPCFDFKLKLMALPAPRLKPSLTSSPNH